MPKRAIIWTGLSQEQRGGRVRHSGCTHLSSLGLPPLSLPSPTSLAYLSVVYLCCREENRSKLLHLSLVEPLPGLLAALATLFVRWFCVQSDFWFWFFVILYGAALYLCFSRTVPLYPLRFFLVFCLPFKLCIEFFCVWN